MNNYASSFFWKTWVSTVDEELLEKNKKSTEIFSMPFLYIGVY